MKPSSNGRAPASSSGKTFYNEHLLAMRSEGGWLMFVRDYVRSGLMTHVEALFIQDLINLATWNQTKVADDGFFLTSRGYLEGSLSWTTDLQKRMVKNLTSKGLIRSEKRGMPARRWLYVDMVKIESFIAEWRFESRRAVGAKPHRQVGAKPHREEETDTSYEVSAHTKSVPRGERHATANGRIRGFIPEYDKPEFHHPMDLGFARRLRGIIKRDTNHQSGIKESDLANQFRILRARYKDEPDLVEEVINWLDEHPKVFTIFSLKSFRNVFNMALDRMRGRKRPEAAPPATISPEAEQLLKDVNTSWGAQAETDQILPAIQQSLDFVEEFRAHCLEYRSEVPRVRDVGLHYRNVKRPDDPKEYLVFARVYVPRNFNNDFLTTHFQDCALRTQNWDSWSGNVAMYALHRDSKYFHKFGRALAERHVGRPDYWNEFLKEAGW